jgi:putative transposase
MPYDYRKLSTKERADIVAYRRAHGYPLHAPPHPFREAGYYLITAANFEHAPIMATPGRLTEFEVCLTEAMNGIRAEVIAWVILPNHYHILVDVESLDYVSATLKYLHGSTSRKWNIEDALTGKRRVWYKFSDRMMRNEKQLYQTFTYIHYNPVKHGYTDDIYQWAWSSVRLYEQSRGRDWLALKGRFYPPPEDFGHGWDD